MKTKLTMSTEPLHVTHPGLRVQVHRNLQNGCWSVVALEGPDRGLVIAHKADVLLEGCTYAAQPAGNARVRATGRKNVHAFIRGTVPTVPMGMYYRPLREVTYDPRKHRGFVMKSHENVLEGAPTNLEVEEDGQGWWVVKSSAVRFCANGRVFDGFAGTKQRETPDMFA